MSVNKISIALPITYGLLLAVAPAAELTTSTLDGGGQRVTGGSYVIDGSLTGVTGISASPSDEQVARHGYIGQLTDMVALELAGSPHEVDEEATTQLTGLAMNDDDTVTAVSGDQVAWDQPDWPLDSIDATGLALADAVYEDTPGPFSGAWHGMSATGAVQVINVDEDNFGTYANDGLPDWWQVQHFGLDNPDAHPDADPTGTGQTTGFRYIAGLDPTDANEVFTFGIDRVPGESDEVALRYNPVRSGRGYTIRYTDDLTDPDWQPVTPLGPPTTNVQEITMHDLDATDEMKLYQIEITLP